MLLLNVRNQYLNSPLSFKNTLLFQYDSKLIQPRECIGSLDSKHESKQHILDFPVLQQVFERRQINGLSELDYALANLERPDSLKDGDVAVDILYQGIVLNKRILIIGDYDSDGATAVALGMLGLKSMGYQNVSYLVPNRFDYGYGLSLEIATVALRESPQIVITVDNGISSIEGVALLKDAGVEVIITDHHLAGPTLPNADAILNPNQPGCGFPSKSIAGVGVMFYLLLLIRAKLKTTGWFEQKNITMPNLAEYMDLVALGTVADVVPLDYNNRILVANGLSRIRKGKCRVGILALLEIANRNYRDVVSSDFGFVVAPRLNAAGRLDDISTGIECLLTGNTTTARQYAQVLSDINEQRKKIEGEMQKKALKIVNQIILKNKKQNPEGKQQLTGLCIHDTKWHQGIVGLVASRIKDKTNQPVIAFAETDCDKLTGSARSISGLHIKDLLESISLQHPALIEKFGGHAMAAGLTIKALDYDQFCSAFYTKVEAHYSNFGITNTILTDGALEQGEINLENAERLRYAAPWGQGFPAPRFEGEFMVSDFQIVGQIHLRMTLHPLDNSAQYQGIAFRAIESDQNIQNIDKIRAVYQLDVNHFRAKKSLQLIIEYMELLEA